MAPTLTGRLPQKPACDIFHKLRLPSGKAPSLAQNRLRTTSIMATETMPGPGEVKDILLREIVAADPHELDVEEVGTVVAVKDGSARIYGLGKAMAGEMLEVTSSEAGEKITALALNLEEDNNG